MVVLVKKMETDSIAFVIFSILEACVKLTNVRNVMPTQSVSMVNVNVVRVGLVMVTNASETPTKVVRIHLQCHRCHHCQCRSHLCLQCLHLHTLPTLHSLHHLHHLLLHHLPTMDHRCFSLLCPPTSVATAACPRVFVAHREAASGLSESEVIFI